MSEYFPEPKSLGKLKVELGKLVIDKLKNVLTSLSNLKSKIIKLDVDKLLPVPVDLIYKWFCKKYER